MEYLEVEFTIKPKQPGTDILITRLCDIGFDSFMETEHGTCAYIPLNLFSENKLKQQALFSNPDFEITYICSTIPEKNWNSEWEKNFEPVRVGDNCIIRAPFHDPVQEMIYDIIIEPKMSFGTGHHETTSLMIGKMIDRNLNCIENKSVLDMGCGTGVLAILAAKMGAKEVTAIDNDEWAYTNSCENIQLNGCPEIKVLRGNADILKNIKCDTILANINRNILMGDIPGYYQALNKSGNLFMSGFFTTDVTLIKEKAESLGFIFIAEETKNNWSVLHFKLN